MQVGANARLYSLKMEDQGIIVRNRNSMLEGVYFDKLSSLDESDCFDESPGVNDKKPSSGNNECGIKLL